MQLGKFTITALETCRFGLDGGAMFGVVPKNLWSKVYHAGDEQNRIDMAARVLLVEWENKKVMVDTGNGNKMNEKLKNIYKIDNSLFSLDKALSERNLTPNDITDVILTHLHFDHAGGTTQFAGKEIAPVFPNAKFYVQKEQLAWARNASEKDRASFMAENYEPLVANGMIELLDGDGEVFPGISVHPIYGHTKAMQMIKITDEGQSLLFPADLMPTHAHVPVPYVMGYDNFPLTTIEEKKKWLPIAAEERWIICFEHDAFVEAGIVTDGEKGFSVTEKVTL